MLTSFLGKSSPSIRLLLIAMIIIGYLAGFLWDSSNTSLSGGVLNHLGFILLSIISLLLMYFIIDKNHLTKQNSYGIFFYSSFMIMLPVVFNDHDIIIANIFLLLALRRIISLSADVNSEKKILDASIWITLASFFLFSSILFFLLLWIAILQKPNVTYKQVLIPFVGFFGVFIIMIALQLLLTDSYAWIFEWYQAIGLDFSAYNKPSVFVPTSVIFAFLIWTGTFRLQKFPSVPLKERPNFIMMLLVLAATVLVAIASAKKSGAEMLFILGPLAIICANYIQPNESDYYVKEDKGEYWFKEVLLWAVLVLPFVFFFL